jgi:nucleotide-binding universal stress UspA family protein
MQDERSGKILVALDRSKPSLEAVRYIAGAPAFRNWEVVLFHVFTAVPSHFWDMGSHPGFTKRVLEVRAWEIQTKRQAEEFLGEAKSMLMAARFSESAVRSVIRNREDGTAADIMREAKQGYAAVALGRKSMSPLRNIVVGSVAGKLVERLTEVPLFLVGKAVNTKKFLIAFDGSENAIRLVDYVGLTVGKECKVTLLHVIRGSEEEYVREAEAFISPLLEQAKARLLEHGMRPEQVKVSLIKGASSRSGTIVSEAKSHRHGTIVVGRRGLSKVQEFFMGSVSSKVVQMAREMTVWIIN